MYNLFQATWEMYDKIKPIEIYTLKTNISILYLKLTVYSFLMSMGDWLLMF